MKQHISQDFTAANIIAAIEQNFLGFTSAYIRTANGVVHEEPDITWIYHTSSLLYFNGVFHSALTAANADAKIAQALDYFKARRQRMSWWVSPFSRPRDLDQYLIRHGLRFGWRDVGMAIDLHEVQAQPTPPDLTIERVEDEATMQAWLHAFGAGYEIPQQVLIGYSNVVTSVPPAQHPVKPFYLARLAGEPVATSALYCDAGVAGIYEVSTIPTARRQGIGAAVVRAALNDAQAMGYRIAVLQASAMGAPVYRRIGFTTYGTLDAYVWEPQKL